MRFPRFRLSVRSLMGIVLACGCLFALIPVLIAVVLSSRATICYRYCGSNLRAIAVAMQSYHADYGCFPPAYLADAQGKPMHSWRVLLLPYLDMREIYNAYNFSEPWNGPNNIEATRHIGAYRCPSDPDSLPGETNYVVVVGPGTAFPVSGSTSLANVRDNVASTLLLVEVRG